MAMAADAELIGTPLDGDGDAFVRLVERHETAVGSYLTRRVGRDAAPPQINIRQV